MTATPEQIRQASDPATPGQTLADLAAAHPDLRPAIAANPGAYADLVAWIESRQDFVASSPAPRTRKRRWPWIAGAAALLLVGAAVAIPVAIWANSPHYPESAPLGSEDVDAILLTVDPTADLYTHNNSNPRDGGPQPGTDLACLRFTAASHGLNWLEGDVPYEDSYGALISNVAGTGDGDVGIVARLFASPAHAEAYVQRLIDDAPACETAGDITGVVIGENAISWNRSPSFENLVVVENAVFSVDGDLSETSESDAADLLARLLAAAR